MLQILELLHQIIFTMYMIQHLIPCSLLMYATFAHINLARLGLTNHQNTNDAWWQEFQI